MNKIGDFVFETDLFLSPMMDITTPSFRQLVYNQGGVGLTVTPMVFVQQISEAPRTVIPHLELIEKQKPVSIQIVSNGKNMTFLKNALDFLSSFDFNFLDINAGCPAPHTLRSGGGGSLLREPECLFKIIDFCIKHSSFPVTLKTRLGFERTDELLKLLPQLEKSGIRFLTVHGRTIKQKYSGTVDLEGIRKVKEATTLPIIGNGDVKSYEHYREMKEKTGVEGVMIGRAATFDPAIFHKIHETAQAVKENKPLPSFPRKSLSLILKYLEEDLEIISHLSKFWNNPRFKLAELRRLSIWFIKGIPGYKEARKKLSRFKEFPQIYHYLFDGGLEQDLDFELFYEQGEEKEDPPNTRSL